MKVLIWCLCLFGYGAIQTLFSQSGSRLGAIPTLILAVITFAAARGLCKAWDEREGANDGTKESMIKPEEGEKTGWVCASCGTRNGAGDPICKSCGNHRPPKCAPGSPCEMNRTGLN